MFCGKVAIITEWAFAMNMFQKLDGTADRPKLKKKNSKQMVKAKFLTKTNNKKEQGLATPALFLIGNIVPFRF